MFAILTPCCETSTKHGKLRFTDEMLSPKFYVNVLNTHQVLLIFIFSYLLHVQIITIVTFIKQWCLEASTSLVMHITCLCILTILTVREDNRIPLHTLSANTTSDGSLGNSVVRIETVTLSSPHVNLKCWSSGSAMKLILESFLKARVHSLPLIHLSIHWV